MPASIDTYRVPALVDLLDSLAFVAVEHGESLDLVRFVALVDLYARHLEATASGDGQPARVTFEAFVRDERLLGRAAETAERESGIPTLAPEPLGGGTETSEMSPAGIEADAPRAMMESSGSGSCGCGTS